MVEFIYNNLQKTSNDFAQQIKSLSCNTCKFKDLIPDGKIRELAVRDGNTIYYKYYDISEFLFDDLWAAISASNYPKVILKYAAKIILKYNIASS